MFTYTAHREVKRPAQEVFAYLADVTKQTEWVHGVTECHLSSAGPIGAGSIAEQSMTFMGKKHVVPMQIVEYVPGQRISFEKSHPFHIRFGFELEQDGGVTRVSYPVEMKPTGFFRFIIHLIGKKTINGDLERIAACVERAS
jgi:uncharacterized protein YndB with AHSA1/START domain